MWSAVCKAAEKQMSTEAPCEQEPPQEGARLGFPELGSARLSPMRETETQDDRWLGA